MKVFLCYSLIVLSFFAETLSLDKIFAFNDAASLKSYIKKNKQQLLLKRLCLKQKENKRPPTACYELSWPTDTFCLSLKTKDLQLKVLKEALKSPFLSFSCRRHLQRKQKNLIYRQKDFLLPQLKNYWTDKKTFF